MTAPLVLAIPTFNGERYLRATLESLNEQGESLRWWLQDGASKDGTVSIAESLKRACDVIVTEQDKGQADALNRAMSQMGGDIIGFINGDDCLLPGASRHVLDFFDRHPEVDLVYGGIEWIDGNGETTGTHVGRIGSLTEVLDIYSVWWKQRQWVQPEVFYRRSLWERVGGFNTSYHLAFDYDFWVRCFLAGAKVAHLPIALTQFRIHPDQKSAAAERAADEIRRIVATHIATDPSVSTLALKKLKAELSYDEYQNSQNDRTAGEKVSFAKALIQNPSWLLSRHVRQRVSAAVSSRLRNSNTESTHKDAGASEPTGHQE